MNQDPTLVSLRTDFELMNKLTKPNFKLSIYNRLQKTTSLRKKLLHKNIIKYHHQAPITKIILLEKIRQIVIKLVTNEYPKKIYI